MLYKLKRLLTRPRALYRSCSKIGLLATIRLVVIRFGSKDKIYRVRVPQWRHPVYVHGGQSTDSMVLYEILVTGEYNFAGGLGAPQTIIDGGANIGLAAVYFLNLYPSARTISVEPFESSVELCRKNLEPYGARATVVQAAIWPDEGSVSLAPHEQESWANRVQSAPAGDNGSGSAQALTMRSLIALCGGSLDLLKLDVEGSEREIFAHGTEEWLPDVRNILVECHGKDCEERVFAALAPYEYEMTNSDAVYFLRHLRPKPALSKMEFTRTSPDKNA